MDFLKKWITMVGLAAKTTCALELAFVFSTDLPRAHFIKPAQTHKPDQNISQVLG
jgi:hypothetical protein